MQEYVKIVVFVPESHAEAVRKTLGEAGAGKLGKYFFVSYSIKGIGRFIPEAGANPAIGKIGKMEEVIEERIEVICPKKIVKDVINVVKHVHPYEEPGIEYYDVQLG